MAKRTAGAAELDAGEDRMDVDNGNVGGSDDASSTVVNTEKATRGMWLVKVPRYLSEVWQKNAGSAVGKLITVRGGETTFHSEIAKNQDESEPDEFSPSKLVLGGAGGDRDSSSPSVSSSAASSQNSASQRYSQPSAQPPQPVAIRVGRPAAASSGSGVALEDIPTQHKFIIRDLNNQSLVVLSEDKSGLDEEAEMRTGKLAIEGRIVCRADCQPPNSTDYMRMKIRQIQKHVQPTRTVQQMERAVVKFKPVNAHQEHLTKERQRKEGARTVRLERDEVVSMLFNAFEKHQYYRQADLQKITNQPAGIVREVLNDIGMYHDSAPHRSMWELKPEYRNYSKQLARNVEEKLAQQKQQQQS